MSYNGSGTFVINTAGQPVVANTVISATVFNALTADLATGLSTAITKDGQTTITANIPFGSNKITGLGAGTAATDAANLGQVQSTAAKLVTVTGTDTLTGTMSPALTAYATGQLFYFIAGAANTGAMTINIDGLGAKSITRDGATALIANDVLSGEIVVICYDGTRFQMINAANSFGNTTINGTLTVTGNAGFQANVSITSALSVGGVFAVTGASTLTGTATLTANPVLSAGTANGVLYLNGSKVATSGSALVFDGSNLGLGVTPSAWGSGSTAFQVGNGAIFKSGSRSVDWITNGYYNGSNYIYNTSNAATYYRQYDGVHSWYNAASGTAGNTITFTQAMTLDASGNLGVGTTSPTAGFRLDVQAADAKWRLQSTTGTNSVQSRLINTGGTFYTAIDDSGGNIFGTAYAGVLWHSGNYPVVFATNNTERARIDSAGRLGVGTTSPASTIQAGTKTSSTSADVSTIFSAGGASASGGKLYAATFCNTVAGANNNEVLISFTPGSAASATGAIGTIFTNSSNGESAMKFYTYGASDGLAERARVASTGQFLIGTTSTVSEEVLSAAGSTAGWRIGSNRTAVLGSGNAAGGFNYSGGNASSATAGVIYARAEAEVSSATASSESGALVLLTRNSGTLAERARITAGGAVFINTTSTLASGVNRLEIYSSNGANDSGIAIKHQDATGVTKVYAQKFLNSSGTEVGSIKISSSDTAYNTSSDRRLKENIQDADNSGQIVDEIKIVKYDWKNGGHVRYGVIAQDLYDVVPEAVSVGDDAEEIVKTWGIDYSKFVPMLIKEVQSLRARVAQLETK